MNAGLLHLPGMNTNLLSTNAFYTNAFYTNPQ